MKINTTTVLKTIDGEAYKEKNTSGVETELTLGRAIGNILVVQKSLDPLKGYQMTNEFLKDEIDIKSEDVVFIKKVLKDHAAGDQTRYFPYIVGQCIALLEPEADGETDEKSKKTK